MSFTPVQKTSAYEAIVEQIEAAIESGELRAGDRLPGERVLMTDFSVSRATVREALRVLQATGLIESRPGDPRGPVITAFSPRLLQKSLAQLSRHGGSSRVELLQFRLFLEGSSAFLAAKLRSPAELDTIETAWQQLEAVDGGDPIAYPARVRVFHDAIRSASGNRLLTTCGEVISDIMADMMVGRIVEDSAAVDLVRRGVADGKAVLDCVRRGDGQGARTAQMGGIYRFYESTLDATERAAIGNLT